MKRFLLFLFVVYNTTLYAQRIKVACVGNSVTYGYGIENREKNSYPAQLQQMLGDGYEVMNFGKSGATLLRKGHRPYNEQEEYKAALLFAADQVIIHLGLNDTDPRNWPNYQSEFVKDYLTLINSFREANPHCKIWICRLSPISHRHSRFKSGTRDWYWQIQHQIEQIAILTQTGLIDLQAPLYKRPDLLPDALHPTIEGAGLIAKEIYQALTGNYGGLQMSPIYSDHMVLQREKTLRINGIANAGETVTVRIANQIKETKTAANGKWSVHLSPMKAGGPYTLNISTPTQEKNYSDVLIGEVWLCSGQSNMAFEVNNMIEKQQKEIRDFIKKRPDIRLFDMKPRWMTQSVAWNKSTLDSLNKLQYYKETTWTTCNEETTERFSAIAFAFGRMLSDSLQVPIGLIHNAIGGSPTEAWIDRKTLEFEFPDMLYNWKENDFIQKWVRERASLNVKLSTNKQQRHPYEPCYLFEAGIEPLGQYPLRGVIWYQGESNAHNIETHEKLFPMLVTNWRQYWQEVLPFYYVQLSSLNRPSWPQFRDSQRRMLQIISNSGMAVSSDKGDSLDVHPRHKQEIGERLARWALHQTYGKETLIPSGPLYRSVHFKGNAAYITFDYSQGLHSSDNAPLRSFEIAEHKGLFVPAQAEIVEGNRVKVWSDQIQNPRFVRYGWQPFTRANLVNEVALPASTFQTDESAIRMISLPKLPDGEVGTMKGLSAPFTGINQGVRIVAGGCNFPKIPASEGGCKQYYKKIYVLDKEETAQAWKEVGELPTSLAYGASVTTPTGVAWIGGNNQTTVSKQVYWINWNPQQKKIQISELPELPVAMDNLAATYADGWIYVAGGNKDIRYTNALLALSLTTPEKGWKRLTDFPGTARIQPVLTAQHAADGIRLYLAGGFQTATDQEEAVVCTDMLSYHPATAKWRREKDLPILADGSPLTLTGGCCFAFGKHSLLCLGGVNYYRFQDALNRPLHLKQAKQQGDYIRYNTLQTEANNYLLHPEAWYKFNTTIFQYDTYTCQWTSLGHYDELARAGAGIISEENQFMLINGERKPGIRTPEIYLFTY